MFRNRSIVYLGLLCVLVFISLSCERNSDHNDQPQITLDIDIKLGISDDLEFENYGALSFDQNSSLSRSCYLRTLIEIYDAEDPIAPVVRDTLYSQYDLIDELDLHYTTGLDAKCYDVVIWSDVVESDADGENLFFTASNLKQITYREPYLGNSELKNAFSTNASIDLSHYQDKWNVFYGLQLKLERPQARFEIIASDLEQFLAQFGDDADSTIDDFSVKVLYDGYLPYGFNALIDKPNDARQMISYMTKMEDLGDGNVRLAFDHVLVNHVESKVNVSLTIYDKSGEVVGQIGSISIPVRRNVRSLISGKYLTNDYLPGIGIDPSFDGDINVVIPD